MLGIPPKGSNGVRTGSLNQPGQYGRSPTGIDGRGFPVTIFGIFIQSSNQHFYLASIFTGQCPIGVMASRLC